MNKNCQKAINLPLRPNPNRIFVWFFGLLFILPNLIFAQNSFNSGDFSTGSWGVGDAMSGSAGGSLIITKGVGSAGDKYFRFYGDGSPCGEYQPNTNGDYFTHNVVVTAPNANCGSGNAWRINVPSAASNVVFKTDGGNDGMDRSIAFVIQGTVQSVTSSSRAPSGNVYPGQDVVVTANLSADFSTGQDAWLRYTNDGFATSTVVKMTGSGTTRTGTIPGTTNTPSTGITYYIFTSGDGASISGADADFYTINLDDNGGSNYSYTTQAGWVVDVTGNWSNGATWVGGAVPPTNINMGSITFDATNSTLTLDQDAVISSINIAASKVFVGSDGTPRTLTIVGGGAFTRAGTFTQTTSNTTIFESGGTISAATTWQNLQVGGGALTPTGNQTINGTFQINTGGSVSAAPLYALNSVLSYNTGAYNVGNEWTSAGIVSPFAVTAGRPYNVTLTGSSNVTMPNTNRSLFGDLTIGAGTTLNLNATSGDLLVVRNWVNNGGTFNPNGRAVSFTGTSQSSTITNASGETFDYLIVSKTTSGNLILNNNVTVAASTGDVLQMTNATTNIGSIDLNGNNLSLTGTAGNISIGAGALIRNIIGTGNLIISGGTKNVIRTATSTLVLAAGVNVELNEGMNFNTFTTLNGTLTINSGGYVPTTPPIYGANSNLTYNTGIPGYNVGNEWNATAAGAAGVGRPNNVNLIGTSTLNMPAANRAMAGSINIATGTTLNLNATSGDLLVGANWTNEGTFNPNNRAVNFSGTATPWTINRSVPGGETFNYLVVSKSVASTGTFNCDVTVDGNTGNVLSMTVNIALTLDLGGNNLTFSNNGGSIVIPNSTTAATLRTINNGNININGSKTISRGGGTRVLTANAAVYLNNALTVSVAGILVCNGIVQKNAGGSIVTNPPTYGGASELIYAETGTVNPGLEWNQTAGGAAGAGRPGDVTISNSTTLELIAARGLARDLDIKNGSALVLNAATGSIVVGRSWTRETGGSFTHNNRLVTFGAVTSSGSINSPGTESFGPLTILKGAAASYITMNCNVDVDGTLTISGTNPGRLMIGSNTLTLNGNVTTTATGTISGTSGSNLVVNGTGASCNLTFTTAVAENQLGSLIINRTGPGTVVLSSNLLIDNGSGLNNSNLTLTIGWFQVSTGLTLTVANTAVSGATSGFIFTQTTGRVAYSVTGAGTFNLDFPIGSAANVNSFRRLVLNSVVQTSDNTYTLAATTGSALTVNPTFNTPLLGGSTVRYYPVNFGNLGVLTSIATVSLSVGADDNPIGIDNQTIIQDFGGGWNDIGAVGGSFKTSLSAPNLTSATSTFAFGFTTLGTVFVNQFTGNDAFTGQTSNNVPAGTGPKQTFAAAMAVVTNGGMLSYTAGSATAFVAQTWDINKNINLTQTGTAANSNLTNVTINVSGKNIMPFAPGDVNTATDRITITGHQLVTGMAVSYNNYGAPFGFMPSGINTGTDVLTVGTNIPTGQEVIYQAYPSAGEAGGLTHGTTYFAINVSPTTIRLAASYTDALGGTPVDITSTGSAESHGIVVSEIGGLTAGSTYSVIVIDANTIQLAATNPDALDGIALDLITAGGGNHVLIFTPTYTAATPAFKNPINITGNQAYISPYQALVSTSGTINIAAGNYFMQPTILLTKAFNLVGSGIGVTILDGGGKISSSNTYFGIAYPGTALTACTLSNFTVTRYYTGISRNSSNTNTSNVIEAVESSDNFNRGISWEGSGAIATALTIRNSIFNNNNGVGVYSAGIYLDGMTKVGLNIRNNTCNGNRNAGIEIGPIGATTNFFIKGNSVAGINSVSPLHNSTTEFGIVVSDVSPTGSNSHISDNVISIFGRAGIECRGCVGNGALSGNGSLRVASNYITQGGGPFRVEPNTTIQNEIRDIAGIAVGQINGSAVSTGIAVDSNHVEGLQQPNSVTTAFTAFGIVVAGDNMVVRANLVTGCEVGIQPQLGSSGNENNTPDNFYSRDNSAATSNFLANRNSITSNGIGARNQGLAGTINFMGNWWGNENGPTHASNTNSGLAGFGAGAGQSIPAGAGIAYNAHLGEDPDEDAGTPLLQISKGLKFRLKPAANSIQLSGAGTLYLINQGLSVCQSLTPSTGFTDTLDLAPITWTLPSQSILIRRRMHLRGNFGTGTRPVINGTGSTVHPQEQSPNARMMINVASQNSGVEYIDLRVNVPLFVFGVSNLIGIGDTVLSVASILNGVVYKNNLIQNSGSYNFYSYGIYFKSLNYSSDPSTFTITGNTVGGGTSFGAPVRIWSGRGNITNNTMTGLYALRWGTPVVGTGTWEIANNTFVGSVELNSQQANSTLNVHDNVFNRNATVAHPQGIEIRLNRLPTAFVNIYDNTFNNIGQSGYPYWGILSLRCQNVSITNNTFNAHSGATDFQFIHASTRQQGTLANPTDNFLNTISVKGNIFNGNASAGTNKVGINLARHRSEQTFGTIEIGGPNPADTNTFNGLSRYIECDPFTGNFSAIGLPFSAITGTPDATVVPMDVDFDVTQNRFEVSGGTKAPHIMSKNELLELEDKVQHKIDYASLGFVTVKPMNAFVTPASFLSGYTATPLIGRALDVAADGWKITTKTATYNETVTIDKDLTFANNGNTILQNLTMNGAGKTLTLEDDFDVSTGGNLTLTDGIVQTNSNILRVLNTAVGAVVGGSTTSHINGNLNRAVNTGINYVYPVGNGTDLEELSMTFNSVTSLTDVTARFTNTAPGTNITSFNEAGAQYDDILQSGYWIVEPNVGGNSTNYSMRLKPVNFTNFPSGGGFSYYGIMKRVGAGNWEIQGIYDNPGTPNRVFMDGTIRRNNLSGFSNFGVGAASDVPLPVQFGDFHANRIGQDVELTWNTRSEQNFSHFEVQRSTDGIHFETLQLVSGKSENGANYRFLDLKPFETNGNLLYYRLKMVDFSQKEILSPTRVVKDQLTVKTIEIFPSPTSDFILVNSNVSFMGQLSIYDGLGRLVLSQEISGKLNLNVSALANGLYTLIYQSGDQIEKASFMKK